MADIKLGIQLEGAQAERALRNLSREADRSSKSLADGFKNAKDAFNVFAGNLAANAVTGAFSALGGAAKSLFNTFVVDGVRAAQVQEDAINSLNVALKASGLFSEQTSQSIQEFASSLQATTKFGDEVILQNAALLQSLGQLDEEGLKKGTAAALDLSAALGIDLTSATQLVGKAAAGEIGSFSRYGLIIEKGANQSETFSNALEKINAQFGGAAAGQVKTFSGSVSQLENTFGDLTEEIGFAITKNPLLIAGINQLNTIFQGFSKEVADNRGQIADFVANALPSIVRGIGQLGQGLDLLVRAFDFGWNTITATVKGSAALILSPIAAIAEGFIALQEITGVDLPDSVETGAQVISGLVEDLKNEAVEDVAELQEAFSNPSFLQDFSKNIEEAGDQLDGFIQQQRESAISVQSSAPQRQQEEAAAALPPPEEDPRVIREAAVIEAIRALQEEENLRLEEQALENQAAEAEATEQDIARLAEIEERKKQLRAGFTEEEIKLAETLQKKKDELRKKDKKRIEDEAKFEQQVQQARLQGASQVFGAISSIIGTASEKNFKTAKAFALAEAITSGILAVQRALAAPPGPPFNAPIVAGAAAVATANVVRISAQKAPSRQGGGILPGAPSPTDTGIFQGAPGELVLNRRQQTNLFNAINRNDVAGQGNSVSVTVQGNVVGNEEFTNDLISQINDQIEFRNADARFG